MLRAELTEAVPLPLPHTYWDLEAQTYCRLRQASYKGFLQSAAVCTGLNVLTEDLHTAAGHTSGEKQFVAWCPSWLSLLACPLLPAVAAAQADRSSECFAPDGDPSCCNLRVPTPPQLSHVEFAALSCATLHKAFKGCMTTRPSLPPGN